MKRAPVVLGAMLVLFACGENGPEPRKSGELLFQSNRDGDFDIYAAMPDGSGQRPLTNTSDNEIHPAWSPDGTRIAYVSDRDPAGLYVMNADGSDPRPLQSTTMHAEYPTWAPDGERIAFGSDQGGDAEIWIVNSDGTGLRQLTPTGTIAKSPSWSPDGSRIAFQLALRHLAYTNPEGTSLDLMTTTPDNAADDAPAWSPDGSRIAFVRFVLDTPAAHQSIWVMSSSGVQVQRLTNWTAGIDFTPAWSPNGLEIAFAHDVNDNYDIYLMSWDGTGQRNFTNQPGINFRPSW